MDTTLVITIVMGLLGVTLFLLAYLSKSSDGSNNNGGNSGGGGNQSPIIDLSAENGWDDAKKTTLKTQLASAAGLADVDCMINTITNNFPYDYFYDSTTDMTKLVQYAQLNCVGHKGMWNAGFKTAAGGDLNVTNKQCVLDNLERLFEPNLMELQDYNQLPTMMFARLDAVCGAQ